jgi:hypothetical protein
MNLSIILPLLQATAFATSLADLTLKLIPQITALGLLIVHFKKGPITPQSHYQFESELKNILLEIRRIISQWTLNSLEPDFSQMPFEIQFQGNGYRLRDKKSPHRFGIATLAGVIALSRFRYEPIDPDLGLACIFPLEIQLGIVGDKATPALARQVGIWTAQFTQETVRSYLREECQLFWAVSTLRHVAVSLHEGLAPLTLEAQADAVIGLLEQAFASQGKLQPALSVGRDGIFIPVINEKKYKEASASTLAVSDRNGKRLGTIYLGHMPEAGQTTMTEQLTALIHLVLLGWQGPLPQLEYVTDAGHHPTEYYDRVLRTMCHPCTGELLKWEWVVDYYHACLYITELSEALFGKETKEAASWAAKMRRWLRDKKGGINRVLHSAAAHAYRLGAEWLKSNREQYGEAYRYLQTRMKWMNYWSYRERGLMIGSGITEAGCKIVFTQRFKQSGMKWSLEGGQVVVDMRTMWLSGIWESVFGKYLQEMPQVEMGTQDEFSKKQPRIAG